MFGLATPTAASARRVWKCEAVRPGAGYPGRANSILLFVLAIVSVVAAAAITWLSFVAVGWSCVQENMQVEPGSPLDHYCAAMDHDSLLIVAVLVSAVGSLAATVVAVRGRRWWIWALTMTVIAAVALLIAGLATGLEGHVSAS